MITVLLVDDQELVRTGFAMILDAADGIEVVGAVGDGTEAVSAVKELDPDVVLMDVRMPGMDGIQATRRIVADRPDEARPRILMLTTFDLDEYVYDALSAGASGFLLKDAPAADLIAGIRTIARGDVLLAPSVTRRMIEQLASQQTKAHPSSPALATLTDKESEVLRLIARGYSNKEIDEQIYVSEATVKTHVGHVLQKLGLRDRVQAIVLAYEAGVVLPGES